MSSLDSKLAFLRTCLETESLDVWWKARAFFEDNLSLTQRAYLATYALRSLNRRQVRAVWAHSFRQPAEMPELVSDRNLKADAQDFAACADEKVRDATLAALVRQLPRERRADLRAFLDKLDAAETSEPRKDAA